jgi:tetratricopeptide (TPR) repeat protein
MTTKNEERKTNSATLAALRLVVLSSLFVLPFSFFLTPAAQSGAAAARLNNLGAAYMSQQKFEQALAQFQQAIKTDPQLTVARVNEAIALLNLQRYEPARAALQAVVGEDPKNARAWYNLGLLHKSLGDAEQALEAFTRTAGLQPDDPDTHYFVGLLASQLQQYDKAISAFDRALALNQFHVSAQFGLARAYQRTNNAEKAKQHLDRFQKLTQEKVGAPMGLAYGDQGPLSLAEHVRLPPGAAPAPIAVKFVHATDAGLRAVASAGASDAEAGACFVDENNDRRPDLLLPRAGLYRNVNGRFEKTKRLDAIDFVGCTAGDVDNDGWTDLAVTMFKGGAPPPPGASGLALWRNDGKGGAFEDITGPAGLKGGQGTAALTFVDYDHDGDLDLFAPPVMWRNNGNKTFTDVTEATGLGIAGGASAVLLSDLNNDRAVDFIVAAADKAPVILLNPREGRFTTPSMFTAAPAPAVGMAVVDVDKDGWMDLVLTHRTEPGVTLWRNIGGRRFEPVALPSKISAAWGVAPADFDNDGWIDLAIASESGVVLLRNEGAAGFTARPDVPAPRARGIVTADYDRDGDVDLLVTQASVRQALYRNDGGNANRSLRVALEGLNDNKSAIGAKVEIFAGPVWQKLELQAASGYLGQSSLEVIVGLGAEKDAEVLRLLWPTGVVQDEVELAAGKPHAITEIDRRGSSCPILFSWNGERYEFIADAIGPGIVGHWVAPGVRNTSDPTEYLKVDGALVRPRDGRLSFRLAEPMEEVVYLDEVKLFAIDHPADTDVYPHEYFAATPPFPTGAPVVTREARVPVGAERLDGMSVLEDLRHRDRKYVGPPRNAPFKGFAELHGVEIDLGAWDSRRPLRLVMHGFTDYFTATSVYAAHQAGVTAIVPYVERLDSQGRWVRAIDDIGFPAGLARTMVADLSGKLPAGTERIRIKTNLKVYWDQILIDQTRQGENARQHGRADLVRSARTAGLQGPRYRPAFRQTEVPLAEASLRFLGYPREIPGTPAADLRYAYHQVSRTGPYARHAGSYTRHGGVKPLLTRADDRFVIFGSGDEIALEFDPAALPPLPDGWTRDYFFYADGFAKDMDFYAAYGWTVEPLPYHSMPRYPYPDARGYPATAPHLEYRLDWNTRGVSGREPPSFRFDFR